MKLKNQKMTSSASSADSKPDNYQINAKICRLVEQYPCMYDRSHPHYLKKDVVDQAWVKIAKEMNDSIPSCKERWRNIRTSYARSINVNKIPASANRTKPYYLHEELQFLSLHITPGIPISRHYRLTHHNDKVEILKNATGGEESFDSYAATMRDEEEDNCPERDEGSKSVSSEKMAKIQQEMEQEIIQQERQQQQQQQQQQHQSIPQPIVQIEEEDTEAMINNNIRRNSINYACAPPKKRLRIKDNSTCPVESYPDVKPLDILPQSDYDGIFLQGLLPEMKAMDFRQKIQFKRRIYEVLGEIFDTSASNSTISATSSPYTSNRNQNLTSTSKFSPKALTVVHASDLSMLRRLSNLLQDSNEAPSSSPARQDGISSTVHAPSVMPSNTLHIPVTKIGATTRSSANLMRVRMSNNNTVSSNQTVKQEPYPNEDHGSD
uniref:MADF domain-containing protein n=1 Tax=Glossina brevipalpis TaxID=37001 RepID=A0A1A9WE61_9MUSC